MPVNPGFFGWQKMTVRILERNLGTWFLPVSLAEVDVVHIDIKTPALGI